MHDCLPFGTHRLAPRAIAASLLLGCTPDGPLTLAEVDDPSVYVTWYYSPLGQDLELPHFYVQLAFPQSEDSCAELVPETTVTVGGVPLSVISMGGWRRTGTRLHCTVPTFVLPGDKVNAHPFEDTTSIEVSDGASTFVARALNLFVDRSVSIEEPAGGDLVVDETATLAWMPESDSLGLAAIYFVPDLGSKAPAGNTAPSFVLSGDQLLVDGHHVHFVVPDVSPQTGIVRAEVSAYVPIEACEGFVKCDVAVFSVSRSIAASVKP